jgi:hypothetical protein
MVHTLTMCSDTTLSDFSLGISINRKIKSNRDKIALLILMLSLRVLHFSNMPDLGLADAIILTRALSWHTIPALATDTVCCSATSSKALLSATLSNSSIAHIPSSHSTSAPAYSEAPSLSAETIAVSPFVDIEFPLTYKLFGRIDEANLSNCDLPSPGSPTSRIWLPRVSYDSLEYDANVRSIPALISSLP